MDGPLACLPGHWLHSHEEDTADTVVYRPAGFAFPPARGRAGFTLAADGEAVYHAIAATDGSNHLPGRWAATGPDEVGITVDDSRVQPLVLHVLSCGPDKLTVRR